MKNFIESGILEAYVTGSATEAEINEIIYMSSNYPEVNAALAELETDMEELAQRMAIAPPPGTWAKIEQRIDGLILQPADPEPFKERPRFKTFDAREQYIEVAAADSNMKIHKAWRWVFAAVFVLAKIFLGCAIYFYLENRQAQQQINDLKTEMHQLKSR